MNLIKGDDSVVRWHTLILLQNPTGGDKKSNVIVHVC